jgi:hypothetical protein
MLTIEARQKLLAESLTATGLRLARAEGDAVMFTVDDGHGRQLAITAQHTGEVVRFVAHDALPGGIDPQLIADRDVLSQDWGLGRAFADPVTARWQVGLGLRAPGSLRREAVMLALYQLTDAVRAYEAGVAPRLVVDHPLAPAEVMPRVDAALASMGIALRKGQGGELFSVRTEVQGFGPIGVEIFADRDGAMLMFRARALGRPTVTEDAPATIRMNALNARLEVGAAGLRYGQGLAMAWIGFPLSIAEINPDNVLWFLNRAGQTASWAWVAAAGP